MPGGTCTKKCARNVVVLVRVLSTNQRREFPQTTNQARNKQRPWPRHQRQQEAAANKKKKHADRKRSLPMLAPVRACAHYPSITHPPSSRFYSPPHHRKRRGQEYPHDLPPTYLATYLPVGSWYAAASSERNAPRPTYPSLAQATNRTKQQSKRTRTSTTAVILPAGYVSRATATPASSPAARKRHGVDAAATY